MSSHDQQKQPKAAIQEIPSYLKPYIAEQDPTRYTAMDHASWRFILKISHGFFEDHAHPMYLRGLEETGISAERIPLISEMDEKLQRFGWRAVAVSGFIPPAVFMEFLSLGILPIACEMRKLENLAYTPAPDIVHEAAGHAPIIADPEYSDYLRSYGEISQKAIFSKQDLDVYEAIRNLSEVKENPASSEIEIDIAQARLDQASSAVDHTSEASHLARMSWWTIEYGLIGDSNSPKIYGAGLLSSVGESYQCLKPVIKKIPLDLSCIEMTYDITKPQPQLYVARDFKTLTAVLSQLGDQMAFKRGGREGLEKAKKAQTVITTVLDSGLGISGVLNHYRLDLQGHPTYVKLDGPCQLSFLNQELPGQGAVYHAKGFSTPIGKLKNFKKSLQDMTTSELEALGIKLTQRVKLEFESGITVDGIFEEAISSNGKTLILVFDSCVVKQGSEILFDPSWGKFDMGCGSEVVSVHGGAADRHRYLKDTGGFKQIPGKQKSNLTPSNKELNQLYAKVRKIRESGNLDELSVIHESLQKICQETLQEDWLLRFEILELAYERDTKLAALVRSELHQISACDPSKAEMIRRGLETL